MTCVPGRCDDERGAGAATACEVPSVQGCSFGVSPRCDLGALVDAMDFYDHNSAVDELLEVARKGSAHPKTKTEPRN